jgi:Fe2+ or Zn2+ uptake regulation protein
MVLNEAVDRCRQDTKNALQTVYNALNQGQQKKIIKDEAVKALFDLYGVEYE